MTTQEQEKKIQTVRERLLKQRKPQWAIDLIDEYVDVKEDEMEEAADNLAKRLLEIHEEYTTKFCEEVEKEIREFTSNLISWRNRSYLDLEEDQNNDDL